MSVAYARHDDENIREYKIRLCKNRELYELTWQMVADAINKETGDLFGESKYRKWWYAFQDGVEYQQEQGINEDDILKEIENKKLQFEKEKIKLQDQRREYKKIIRGVARDEQLLDLIQDIANNIHNKTPFQISPIKVSTSNKHAVSLISDWHSEIEIDNFLNKFNKNEFIKRVDRLVCKIIEHGRLNGVKVLHVVNLGDLLSGVIHSTLRIASNEDVITQLMYVSDLLAEVLVELGKEFEEVRFYNVIDNHSRVSADKKESLNKENFMRVVPWYLNSRLKHIPNINIIENDLDDEIAIFDVCGKKCFAVHGHHDKMSTAVQNLSLMTRQFPDYVFLSHFHHNMSDEIHGVEVIVNPCLSGVDEFSKDLRMTSKPAQKLLIFNPEDGLECTYSIRLDR